MHKYGCSRRIYCLSSYEINSEFGDLYDKKLNELTGINRTYNRINNRTNTIASCYQPI